MNIFYEESGQFKVAAVVQKNEATYQADTPHGKRTKVRAANVFFEFSQNSTEFLEKVREKAAEIDIGLLWSACGDKEMDAAEIAREYFGQDTPVHTAAVLTALYAAPVYFHKKARGVFKPAPEETLKQALAAIERKQAQEAQAAEWEEELKAFRLPEAVRADLVQILHRPDKQSLTYKSFCRAAESLKMSPLALAQATGGVSSLPQYFLDGFLLQSFPYPASPEAADPVLPEDLPDAQAEAFSIDDLDTTEIDDAVSLGSLPGGAVRLGIHIAAPSLSIQADSPVEKMIFRRLSTVYYPGGKMTMLPENWLRAFSMDAGRTQPCISLYFEIAADGTFSAPECRIEKVTVADNLRLQEIEPFFNRENGTQAGGAECFPHHGTLKKLYTIAQNLQKKRGKWEENPPLRYDYGVQIDDGGKVEITRRERGSPIDTVVSELMILANSTWGAMLENGGCGAIFRVQPAGAKVRFSTKSEAHEGLGVAHYAWCTSPLRRGADYINQRQLLALIDSRYPPRFHAKDVALFSAMRDFEAAKTAYDDFQQKMEYYWSLVYVQQQEIRELYAVLIRGDLVRVEGLPIVTRATGIPVDILPKTRLHLRVNGVDLTSVSLMLAYIDAAPAA